MAELYNIERDRSESDSAESDSAESDRAEFVGAEHAATQDSVPAGGLSRRRFLALAALAAAAAALPGCGGAMAPEVSRRARREQSVAYASPVVGEPQQVQYIIQQPAPRQVVYVRTGGKVSANSRSSWGATPAIPGKMKAMGGVNRITIHHEGSAKPNNDTTPAQVAATLRLIQSQHRKRMSAGDIGYHFIIDRTGAIWQGRDWDYQGAHASGANPHNIGVMLLGNFEIQQPTAAQLYALRSLTASLVRKYGLNPATDIYGHSDFGKTQCPGKNLKPHVRAMRTGA